MQLALEGGSAWPGITGPISHRLGAMKLQDPKPSPRCTQELVPHKGRATAMAPLLRPQPEGESLSSDEASSTDGPQVRGEGPRCLGSLWGGEQGGLGHRTPGFSQLGEAQSSGWRPGPAPQLWLSWGLTAGSPPLLCPQAKSSELDLRISDLQHQAQGMSLEVGAPANNHRDTPPHPCTPPKTHQTGPTGASPAGQGGADAARGGDHTEPSSLDAWVPSPGLAGGWGLWG